MASISFPNSAGAPVTAVAATVSEDLVKRKEDLTKRVEDALKMGGVSEMSANGLFAAFCEWLKTCSIDDILVILPKILNARNSEDSQEMMNAHDLLGNLGDNENFSDAVKYFFEHTDWKAYLSSEKLLAAFCSALKKAGLHNERVEILVDMSKQEKLSLVIKNTVCELLLEDLRSFGASGRLGTSVYLAALICTYERSRDGEDSRDLGVKYFTGLFEEGYFAERGVTASQLLTVIKHAHSMLCSSQKELLRWLEGLYFFKAFFKCATPEQLNVLPESIVNTWEKHSEILMYKERFEPLLKQYREKTATAVSSS